MQNNLQAYHGYAPGVAGAPQMQASINQKLAHQFMLKQQFKYVEAEINAANITEDLDQAAQYHPNQR